MIRRSFFAFASLLAVGALALTAWAAPPTAAPMTLTVKMDGHRFVDPFSNSSTTEIRVGDSVRWTAVSAAPHTATANDGSFRRVVSKNGDTSEPVTFTQAGTYPYYCEVHGKGMSGVIVVK